LFDRYDENSGRSGDADDRSYASDSDDDASNDGSDSESDSSDSDSESGSSSAEMYGYSSGSPHASEDEDSSGSRFGSGFGDDDSDSTDGSDSEPRARRAIGIRRQSDEGTSGKSRKKKAKEGKDREPIAQEFVAEKADSDSVKGKIVIQTIPPDHSTPENVMSLFASILEAGALGAVFIVHRSKMVELFKTIGRDDAKAPLAFTSQMTKGRRKKTYFMDILQDELKKRHVVSHLCSVLPEHADNVQAEINESNRTCGVAERLKSMKHR
jgi:hypothetical protein